MTGPRPDDLDALLERTIDQTIDRTIRRKRATFGEKALDVGKQFLAGTARGANATRTAWNELTGDAAEAAQMRTDRQAIDEWAGESLSGVGTVAGGLGRVGYEIGEFALPGAALGRAAKLLQLGGKAAKLAKVAKAGEKIAEVTERANKTVKGRAALGTALNAPLTVTKAADKETSAAPAYGALAHALGSDAVGSAIDRASESFAGRALIDVAGDALGNVAGEKAFDAVGKRLRARRIAKARTAREESEAAALGALGEELDAKPKALPSGAIVTPPPRAPRDFETDPEAWSKREAMLRRAERGGPPPEPPEPEVVGPDPRRALPAGPLVTPAPRRELSPEEQLEWARREAMLRRAERGGPPPEPEAVGQDPRRALPRGPLVTPPPEGAVPIEEQLRQARMAAMEARAARHAADPEAAAREQGETLARLREERVIDQFQQERRARLASEGYDRATIDRVDRELRDKYGLNRVGPLRLAAEVPTEPRILVDQANPADLGPSMPVPERAAIAAEGVARQAEEKAARRASRYKGWSREKLLDRALASMEAMDNEATSGSTFAAGRRRGSARVIADISDELEARGMIPEGSSMWDELENHRAVRAEREGLASADEGTPDLSFGPEGDDVDGVVESVLASRRGQAGATGAEGVQMMGSIAGAGVGGAGGFVAGRKMEGTEEEKRQRAAIFAALGAVVGGGAPWLPNVLRGVPLEEAAGAEAKAVRAQLMEKLPPRDRAFAENDPVTRRIFFPPDQMAAGLPVRAEAPMHIPARRSGAVGGPPPRDSRLRPVEHTGPMDQRPIADMLEEKARERMHREVAQQRLRAQGLADAYDLTNPIDPALPPEAKVRALRALSEENVPLVEELIGDIDAAVGTRSAWSHKLPERILEKAARPSIRAEKPWHDVEHVRDALRFKTRIENLDQLEDALAILRDRGVEVVKADLDKLLEPKEWGWRFAAFDLRMPNGQLVEWYLPFKELDDKAVKGPNHLLFERWRNQGPDLTPEQYQQRIADVQESRARYEAAFDQALGRQGVTREQLASDYAGRKARLYALAGVGESPASGAPSASSASATSASAAGPETMVQSSLSSSAEGKPLSSSGPDTQAPPRLNVGNGDDQISTSPERSWRATDSETGIGHTSDPNIPNPKRPRTGAIGAQPERPTFDDPADLRARRATPGNPAAAAGSVPRDVPPVTEHPPKGPAGGAIDPEEFARLSKFALDETGEQRLREEVTRVVREQGLHPKQRVTWERTRAEARKLGLDPEALAREHAGRMTGPELLAARNLVKRNVEQLVTIEKELATGTVGAERGERLERIRGMLEAQNDALLGKFVQHRSHAGRDLNSLKILAEQTNDPVFWLTRAKRRLGDRPMTDAVRAQVLELLNKQDRGGLAKFILELKKDTWTDKVLTLWKAGMLTSPTTHAANTLGNTVMAGLETVKDAPAAGFDALIGAVTGRRTKAGLSGRSLAASWKGAKKGIAQAKKIMRDGVVDDALDKFDVRGEVQFDNWILDRYTKTVFRSLAAADRVFRGAALARSIEEQSRVLARSEGLKGAAYARRVRQLQLQPTDEIVLQAIADADLATFQNKGVLASAASGLKQGARRVHPGAGAALDVVLPFTRTPGNVAARVAEYSPLGAAAAAAELLVAATKGDVNAALQRKVAERLGRAATGTAAIAVGYYLASQGKLVAGRPRPGSSAADQFDLEGKQGNSVLVDGAWRRLDRISPIGNLLALGGHLYTAATDPDMSAAGKTLRLASGVGQTVVEQSFLRGVSDVIDAVRDEDGALRGTQRWVENLAGSAVPAIVGRAAQALDPVVREPKGAGERLASRIPGMSQDVTPRIDQLGREVTRGGTGAGALFDPFASRDDATAKDPLVAELARVGARLSRLKQDTRNGETRAQFLERQQLEGRELEQLLGDAMASDEYLELSDVAKDLVENDPKFQGRRAPELARELQRSFLEDEVRQYRAGATRARREEE